jgi:uncharacterized Zn ribbon protein
MAFASETAWTNLPNGNFSPVIYSKQAQIAFRKSATAAAITNSDYFGEIANQGDTVRIIKEPEITVNSLKRGTPLVSQALNDADFSLVIDQANYFQFELDDIEEAHSHIDFMRMATDRAGYRLADTYDLEVLAYMSGYNADGTARTAPNGTKADSAAGADELLAANKLDITSFGNITTAGSAGDSIPVAPRLGGAQSASTTTATPLQILARMGRLMDQRNVDTRGRWVVVDPVFVELLKDEDSRLLNADFGGAGLQNGLVLNNLHGFRVYVSNNTVQVGTGSGTSGATAQSTNYGVLVAGHDSAVATAEQINKVESFRSQTAFADVVRGAHLYGRKILRPEAIVTANYNAA